MGMRVRMGPVSLSSRGRVGLHAGPVSVYGGGRRRSSSGGGGAALLGGLLLLALVVAAIEWAIKHWYISIPALIALGYVGYLAMKAEDRRREEARKREAAALKAWLAGPPPPLPVPGRFTTNWFAANVPSLHPGQIPVLLTELQARGWTQEKIATRVMPYIQSNPYA
jgi:hypothetical protein